MEPKERVPEILIGYDPTTPRPTADALRAFWLQFEAKSVNGIKAEQRNVQEMAGTPVKTLRAIGRAVGQAARKRVEAFVPLARLLWDAYGREGRIVAAVALGKMELADPERILPLLIELGRTCLTWEDANQLATVQSLSGKEG
jgi:hypothetical protein